MFKQSSSQEEANLNTISLIKNSQSVEESRKHEAKGPMKRSMAETITRETKGEGQRKAKRCTARRNPKRKEKRRKRERARKHNIMCSCKLHVIYIPANLTASPHRATFSTVHTCRLQVCSKQHGNSKAPQLH